MNKVVLVGRLTKDPELRYAAGSDTAVCKFTLAVKRMKKDEADFINCVAFNKTAETIANYLVKGRKIAIAGRIQTNSYTSDDGTKRYTIDVIVESFDFIDSNSSNRNNTSNSSMDDDFTPVDDGDMPF